MQKIYKLMKHDDEIEKLNEDGLRIKTDWVSIIVLSISSFLGTLQAGAFRGVTWPYLKVVDPKTSDLFAGFLQTAQYSGSVISSLLSGYVCNRLNQTKYSMMLSKSITIAAAIIYICLELMNIKKRYIFLVFEFIFGFGVGCLLIGRTHVAMASTEADRQRAVAINNFAISLGFTIGPLIEVAFNPVKYPGPNFGRVHINLYTLAAYLSIITCLISIIILTLFFHGRLRPKEYVKPAFEKHNRLDKIAIINCLIQRCIFNWVGVVLNTLGLIYAMTVFAWSSSEATFYHSIANGIIGAIAAIMNISYIGLKLIKILPERIMILTSLFFFFIFFLATYPWPSYGQSIKHQEHINTTENQTILTPGCKISYKWCNNTPQVNVWVYYAVMVIFIGLGTPLITVNLDILFSKILGPIKQGTMHGVFLAAGDFINIFGPVAVSTIYVLSGPRWIWLGTMIILLISFAVFLLCYSRMVPYYHTNPKKCRLKS